MGQGCGTDGQASVSDVLDHFDWMREGKSGILMAVHLIERLELPGGVVLPSLSNSIQMKYNLLELYS